MRVEAPSLREKLIAVASVLLQASLFAFIIYGIWAGYATRTDKQKRTSELVEKSGAGSIGDEDAMDSRVNPPTR